MSAPPPSVRHVLQSDPHQLVLDDLLIAEQRGLARRLGQPERYAGNPVLVPTEPHEGTGVMMYGTLAHDEGRYRCWYQTQCLQDSRQYFCYAESEDGIAWRKPALGRVTFGGSRDNNILMAAPEGMKFTHGVVAKSTVEPDPNRRYRAVLFMYVAGDPRGPTRGHYVVCSPDGIDWSRPDAAPNARCNECGGLLWDESRTDFVDLNKTGHALEMFNREDMRVGHTRCTAVANSDDGVAWSPYRVVLMPNLYLDEPYDEFYYLHGFRWGGSYVGYLRVYHNTPECGAAPRQRIDVQLATSRDGETWERVCPGQDFVTSAEPRKWDFGRIAMGNGPPAVTGDRMRIYYCGQPTDHRGFDGLGGRGENGLDQGYTAKVGFATLRKDGFACLAADGKGELVTRPVTGGPFLRLNVDATGGACRVEVRDASGNSLPGFGIDDCVPLCKDQVDAPVAWRRGQEIPCRAGEQIRLRIELTRARLFAWTFGASGK